MTTSPSPEAWQAYLLQQDCTVPGLNVSSGDINSDECTDIISQLWAGYQEEPAAQICGAAGNNLQADTERLRLRYCVQADTERLRLLYSLQAAYRKV